MFCLRCTIPTTFLDYLAAHKVRFEMMVLQDVLCPHQQLNNKHLLWYGMVLWFVAHWTLDKNTIGQITRKTWVPSHVRKWAQFAGLRLLGAIPLTSICEAMSSKRGRGGGSVAHVTLFANKYKKDGEHMFYTSWRPTKKAGKKYTTHISPSIIPYANLDVHITLF